MPGGFDPGVVPTQPPQCASSLSGSTQVPPQLMKPSGQHLPLEQSGLLVPTHDVLQLPQCAGSVCVSKHWLPHAVCVPPQHVPFWQNSAGVPAVSQTSPHVPQFPFAVCRSTH